MTTYRNICFLVVLAAMVGGCANKPPTPEEEVKAWLAEAPRDLAVHVSPDVPAASLRVHDSRPAERLGKGAAGAGMGALYTVAGGCRAAGPIGCAVGVVFAPVGAVIGGVAGAVSVNSVTHYHGLADAHGAPELFASAVDSQLSGRLASALLAESRTRSRHLLSSGEKPAAGQGELSIKIAALDLAGEVGDDPSVALVLEVEVYVDSTKTSADWGRFTYQGSERRVSEWRQNDAAAFREELDKAVRSVATDVAARF
jgi:hypothetical protein